MTEITKAHAEWAVVDRLRCMLSEPPHPAYNVTQSYALCMAILAWVMQRIRTPETASKSPEDQAALAVKAELKLQRIDDLPWALQTEIAGGKEPAAKDFHGWSAFDFLKWFRDASCHGDARQVVPVNSGSRLMGFTFRATARNDTERFVFLGEADLRRLGQALARIYCHSLRAASSSPALFDAEVRSLRERQAAA